MKFPDKPWDDFVVSVKTLAICDEYHELRIGVLLFRVDIILKDHK